MICEMAGNKLDVALFTHISRGFHIIYSEKQSNQQYECLRDKLFVVALRARHLEQIFFTFHHSSVTSSERETSANRISASSLALKAKENIEVECSSQKRERCQMHHPSADELETFASVLTSSL